MSESSTVRCKFKCNRMEKRINYSSASDAPRFIYEYEFSIVYEGSEENKRFFASTPTGNLKIGAIRDDLFELGLEYYLDLKPTD